MTGEQKIKVLVVEDSNVIRMLIGQNLNSSPRIQVIGRARNGREAMQFLSRQRPDIILMDVDIPGSDSLETIQLIMETQPVPIVICSRVREAAIAVAALETGAVAWVEKPSAGNADKFATTAVQLRQTVELMSEIKVVHRWPRTRRNATGALMLAAAPPPPAPDNVKIIGIGASTGGPPVLKTILLGLPHDFRVPILVVQHIARGFLDGLVDWLSQTTGIPVHIASHGHIPEPGHVYLAPDDCHMEIAIDGTIALVDGNSDDTLRPSVSHLFRSLAEFYGPSAVGVLLTGMGKDGARELQSMRDRGATTIAQDRETSAVHGMPGEAIRIGAATCILPAEGIAPTLVTLIDQPSICQGARS